jgi:hypothetical protein
MDGGVTTWGSGGLEDSPPVDRGSGLEEAAGLLGAARRIVVFSGAGISTDSRIIL